MPPWWDLHYPPDHCMTDVCEVWTVPYSSLGSSNKNFLLHSPFHASMAPPLASLMASPSRRLLLVPTSAKFSPSAITLSPLSLVLEASPKKRANNGTYDTTQKLVQGRCADVLSRIFPKHQTSDRGWQPNFRFTVICPLVSLYSSESCRFLTVIARSKGRHRIEVRHQT